MQKFAGINFYHNGHCWPICHWWWYLSCVCHEQVVPDSRAYYCQRCNQHVLMITLR